MERARLAFLVRLSVAMVATVVVVDSAVSRASGSANAPAPTTTTSAPPVTLVPLASTPGVAPVVTRVETTDPVVFLTIDDGWTRSPDVSAAFAELGVPATLFLLDGPLEADPGFFRGLPDTVVESHTRTHPDLSTLSEEQQRAEICGNADMIGQTFGRRPVLFRPPYGAYNGTTQRAAADCGMAAVVMWEATVDEEGVISHSGLPQLRRGDILLMHFRPSFVTELRALAEEVEAAGLRFALLEDYLVPDSVG
ncbi:MAG TPA: polysaccharide deacetylase family protein [Acidimicrobiales bacterium]|nr:polysaccharide deacetylase family protein [Acidimicrobiales bacterium]